MLRIGLILLRVVALSFPRSWIGLGRWLLAFRGATTLKGQGLGLGLLLAGAVTSDMSTALLALLTTNVTLRWGPALGPDGIQWAFRPVLVSTG